MATSPRWLPLLVLGLLVGLPGSLASIGAEIFTDSRAALKAVEGAVDDPEMVASMVQM